MSCNKKSVLRPRGLTGRLSRVFIFLWGLVIALGALTTYLRPILPWIAGGIVVAVATWIVVAFVRWRRSKW
jgi:cytochrome c biogenesis protein CcdA